MCVRLFVAALNHTTGQAFGLIGTAFSPLLRGCHYISKRPSAYRSRFLLPLASVREWEKKVSLSFSPSLHFEFSFYLLTFLWDLSEVGKGAKYSTRPLKDTKFPGASSIYTFS
jgi:hypothetical protein